MGRSPKTQKPSDIVLPPDAPFEPSRIFYIPQHLGWTRVIEVRDVTAAISVPHDSNELDDAARKAASSPSAPAPCLTVRRNDWLSQDLDVFLGATDQAEKLAHWKAPFWSTSTTTLEFVEDSPHVSHPVKMKPNYWGSIREEFTAESVPFRWEPESRWKAETRNRLVKVVGGQPVVVARLVRGGAMKGWTWRSGGTLVLDDRQADWALVVLTALVMLKKMRQREAEWTY